MSRAHLLFAGTGLRLIVFLFDEKDELPYCIPFFGYSSTQIDNSNFDDHWQARNLQSVNNRLTLCNLFIKIEAGVDEDASTGEDDNDGADLAEFLINDYFY